MRFMPELVMDPELHENEDMSMTNDVNRDYLGNVSYDGQYIEEGEAGFIAILYLSYMPLCCFVGLTGNCMVLILIR